MAINHLKKEPNQQEIQNILHCLKQQQPAQAESLASSLIQKYPAQYALYNLLGIAQDAQDKLEAAAASYREAVRLQPRVADIHFNLGIVLDRLQRWQEAIASYQAALQLNPQFFEAYGNLGIVLQRMGRLEEATQCYRKGLKINPQDARGHFNLGTALRDQGLLKDAIASYRIAIQLFPNYADAWNNLGETLRDHGQMEEAVQAYQETLRLNPQHAQANYNMAEFLYLAKRYDAAIPHFERSQLDDWQARSLYCLYKAEHFDAFKVRLDKILQQGRHTSPFVATLSTHYALNFGLPDPYNFCRNGLEFVYNRPIPELAAPDSPLLKALLHDIETSEIAPRVQGMLHAGIQSAGNLFKRPEASFRQLAELVRQAFVDYQQHFADADCELIRSFPQTLEFTSSWYVRMRQGGHLDAHIHEIGWISGAVYLAMPDRVEGSLEGAFEYGTHGDQYPQKHTRFPVGHVVPNVGDIVLFPSSLFHRTIPFSANQERICIAFDLRPEKPVSGSSSY